MGHAVSIPAPQATYIEDEYIFLWDALGVELVVERFREDKGAVYADVTPRSATGDGFFPPDKLNLGSARSIKQYANTLGNEGLLSSDEWFHALSQAAKLSLTRYRDGEPSVVLADVEWQGKQRYVIAPYIDRHGTTILFGDGAVSKSIHALSFGISVATGTTIIPNTEVREQGAVLYLDWEADAETHAERLQAICAGHGIEPPTNLHYMRRVGSIASSVREIRREIAMRQVVLAIVDSVGAACGGDPEQAASVIAAMNAIRAFGVPTLAIHHIAKDAKDKTKPFGSVYSPNLARRTWRLDKEQAAGEQAIYVRALNYKANNGRLYESLAHSVRFGADEDETLHEVVFATTSPGRAPVEGRGLKNPIASELRSGPLTVPELALALNAKEDTIRKTLKRWPDWFVQVGDGWALVAPDDVSGQLSGLSETVLSMSKTGQTIPPLYRGDVSDAVPPFDKEMGSDNWNEVDPW